MCLVMSDKEQKEINAWKYQDCNTVLFIDSVWGISVSLNIIIRYRTITRKTHAPIYCSTKLEY